MYLRKRHYHTATLVFLNTLISVLKPYVHVQLERVLASRGGQFFAGNRLSWAELHFLQLVDLLSAQNEKV